MSIRLSTQLLLPLGLLTTLASAILTAAAEIPARTAIQEIRATGGMVVSDSEIASQVGSEVLEAGGNAVDAAVATAFALAVVWPEAGNIGGGGFMMIHPGEAQTPVCVDYRETAPRAATETMFATDNSRHRSKAVGVPGTVRGLELAHRRFGKLSWKQVVTPAAKLAGEGFVIDEWLAHSTNGVLSVAKVREDARFSELRRVYGRPDGEAWTAGDTMVLPDLASTLRQIAADGADAFYRGEIADQIVAQMQRGNGLITSEDLVGYQAKLRAPIRGSYREFELFGPPPPSSGGFCVIEAMNILEPFKLREHPRFGSRNMHLITEAMRRVFCDRARYLADPDFTEIPATLQTKAHAAELANSIDLAHATKSETLAPDIDLAPESPDTTHFSVIDRHGMAVSNTYTLEASWGSRIVVAGAGFVLNNEMGDFNWDRGVTRRTGQIGTAPNLIEPGKRMLSSQSPFIVTRNGKAFLLTGSPGGRTIINTVLGNLLNVLEFDMTLAEALDAPRMHHQWFPDELRFEGTKTPEYSVSIEQLRMMGHTVLHRDRQGSAHSIQVDKASGQFIGVADWRRGGAAIGVDAAAAK
ncbi:MAG: gamma-glutamyltransferase [Planctomycetaceae bacterium]|nr:gamma-glutamyltransferase [Planctomycetales bacterium]MCB9926609.1 gamma-glutamyltransferase [Planctomycetaceae bacterium]